MDTTNYRESEDVKIEFTIIGINIWKEGKE